jgi:glycine oxidase
MLVGDGTELPPALQSIAAESARMYPEFVHELEDESGIRIDFRKQGTILISNQGSFPASAETIAPEALSSIEPSLAVAGENRDAPRLGHRASGPAQAAFIAENSVDPRTLMSALIKAAKHRGVDVSSGSHVEDLLLTNGRVCGVITSKTSYSSTQVINCAGAWTSRIGPQKFPMRPVKGQMLAVVGGPPLRHVLRGDDAYLVPRSDGRIVIGSTLEEAGFDKQIDANTIERLFHAAVELLPALGKARQHEAWAGLRPATPDFLPILGETSTPGYFVASGHYRDGILLAPVTAQILCTVVLQEPCKHDLRAFSATRFHT